jgi:hypothetical protein
MRSPNFPGISLEKAIQYVAVIFDKNRHASITNEDVAKDLGYSGLSGRSLKLLGALNQFGLLEYTGKGQVRVTKTASDILHGFPDDVKLQALRKAGASPALFQSIYDRFDGDVPGENAVRSFLIQSGFTNEGAAKALAAFMATNQYLGIAGATESTGNDEAQATESAPHQEKKEAEHVATPESSVHIAESVGKTARVRIFENVPLNFQFTMDGLKVTGGTRSAKELDIFIAKLEALKVLLSDDDSPVGAAGTGDDEP